MKGQHGNTKGGREQIVEDGSFTAIFNTILKKYCLTAHLWDHFEATVFWFLALQISQKCRSCQNIFMGENWIGYISFHPIRQLENRRGLYIWIILSIYNVSWYDLNFIFWSLGFAITPWSFSGLLKRMLPFSHRTTATQLTERGGGTPQWSPQPVPLCWWYHDINTPWSFKQSKFSAQNIRKCYSYTRFRNMSELQTRVDLVYN